MTQPYQIWYMPISDFCNWYQQIPPPPPRTHTHTHTPIFKCKRIHIVYLHGWRRQFWCKIVKAIENKHFCQVSRTLVGGFWSVFHLVGGEFLVWSVVGGFYGRCWRWSVSNVVGARWLMVGGLWLVGGRWFCTTPITDTLNRVLFGRWSFCDRDIDEGSWWMFSDQFGYSNNTSKDSTQFMQK